jgi:hypothetical protein
MIIKDFLIFRAADAALRAQQVFQFLDTGSGPFLGHMKFLQ